MLNDVKYRDGTMVPLVPLMFVHEDAVLQKHPNFFLEEMRFLQLPFSER